MTPAQLQQRSQGPFVWLDMDQAQLDDAYDQEKYAPNRGQIVARRIANSERTRAIIGPPQRVAYGPSENEQLDIFRTARSNAPVNIFVHGGGWQRNCAADYALQAEVAERMLQSAGGAETPIVAWATAHAGALAPVEGLAREIRAAANPDLAMLFVASRQLRQALG